MLTSNLCNVEDFVVLVCLEEVCDFVHMTELTEALECGSSTKDALGICKYEYASVERHLLK